MPYKKKSALKRNMGHGGGREGVYIIFGCTAKEIQDKFINANVPSFHQGQVQVRRLPNTDTIPQENASDRHYLQIIISTRKPCIISQTLAIFPLI
jgi:hypothetical protein